MYQRQENLENGKQTQPQVVGKQLSMTQLTIKRLRKLNTNETVIGTITIND